MRVIITGATKGIGRAIAEKFAQQGADLAVCARTPEDLQQMKASFAKTYPSTTLLTQATDMSKKDEVLAFAKMIHSKWKTIDVLVNNAGIFLPDKISEAKDNLLEHMINTNLYSAYHITRALLPLMLAQGKGHIFNICSVASLMAYPNGASYCISKFALLGFSKVLREELKEKHIKVTAILPGATWSNSWAGVDFPEDRLMQASDIAQAIWCAYDMGPSAVVEDIVIRPMLGDL